MSNQWTSPTSEPVCTSSALPTPSSCKRGRQRFECTACGRRFHQERNLIRHCRALHPCAASRGSNNEVSKAPRIAPVSRKRLAKDNGPMQSLARIAGQLSPRSPTRLRINYAQTGEAEKARQARCMRTTVRSGFTAFSHSPRRIHGKSPLKSPSSPLKIPSSPLKSPFHPQSVVSRVSMPQFSTSLSSGQKLALLRTQAQASSRPPSPSSSHTSIPTSPSPSANSSPCPIVKDDNSCSELFPSIPDVDPDTAPDSPLSHRTRPAY
uniref:ARAD1C14432p n=1 Tax=Blastobotrys adeninivorans TaxID=409370 RepID=A0A060T0N2_BLAAD